MVLHNLFSFAEKLHRSWQQRLEVFFVPCLPAYRSVLLLRFLYIIALTHCNFHIGVVAL